jgi:hypothetical protein
MREIYVDWAWDHTCELNDEEVFASLLRKKLNTITRKHKSQGS